MGEFQAIFVLDSFFLVFGSLFVTSKFVLFKLIIRLASCLSISTEIYVIDGILNWLSILPKRKSVDIADLPLCVFLKSNTRLSVLMCCKEFIF